MLSKSGKWKVKQSTKVIKASSRRGMSQVKSQADISKCWLNVVKAENQSENFFIFYKMTIHIF